MVILREWNLKPYDSYMTYLSVENLSKQFGGDPLFEGLTFRIGREDKTALVAENGSGKSTLLKILAGKETPETGEVMIQKGITTGYLEQDPLLDDTKTIREYKIGRASCRERLYK